MSSKKIVKLCSMIIDNCEDVPHIFKDGFNYLCLDCKNFPFSIYTQDEDNQGIYSQLISLTEEGIFIFDIKNTGIRLTQYPYTDIILIKKTNNTDKSTICIEGFINSRVFQSKIEFDNLQGYIFDMFLDNIRLKGVLQGDSSVDNSYELLKLGFLKEPNPRMYNFAAECMLSNRTIKNIVLQKKLVIRKLKVLRKLSVMPHVIILTEDELIVIEEGRHRKKEPGLNIGGFWSFIPINNIISMDIISSDNFLLCFTIKLKGNEEVKLIYENSSKYQLEQLVKTAHAVYQMR